MSKLTVRNRIFSNPFDVFDHFDSAFPSFYKSHESRAPFHTSPRANVVKSIRGYHIELAAPGLSRDDFEMDIERGLLSISVGTEDGKEYNNNIHSREWARSAFSRRWTLPDTANIEAVTARYEAGVLFVEIPLGNEKETRRVIPVE